jgi:hypothetical protein
MLAFLTDAHISPHVAKQVRAKQPEILIHCLRDWRGGAFLHATDEAILAAALEENLSFVTYDQRTIAPLATQWLTGGRDQAGIIFIDVKRIPQEDIGGKVRALLSLWERAQSLDWTNAISYLKPDV